MRPLIAIVGRRSATVPVIPYAATLAAEALCEAVHAGGGEPVVFYGRGGDDAADLVARLDNFDAVLMPGGADVSPDLYGAEQLPQTVMTDPVQDHLDLAVTRAVLGSTRPMLSICRGMQVLNVACGGTLLQDVATSPVQHHKAVHDVTIRPGSCMHEILEADRVSVSSYHHQAVDRVGRGLMVTGTADDGVVEVLEHDLGRVIGIQWHPEDFHASSSTDRALFVDLVRRAEEYRASR